MKKSKIVLLVIAAVLFISGCIPLGYGLILKNNNGKIGNDLPIFEPFSISEEDSGKTFSFKMTEDVLPAGENENGMVYIITYSESEEEDSDYTAIGIEVPFSQTAYFESAYASTSYFQGTLDKCDAEIIGIMEKGISDYIISVYEMMEMEMPEGEIEQAVEKLSPYYIKFSMSEKAESGSTYILVGAVIIAVSLFILLIAFLGKKFLLAVGGVLAVVIIVLIISLWNKIRTMTSVKEISDGFYSMTCHYDYECDDFISADIGSIDELINWIIDEQFYGIPIELDTSNFGCSAFSAVTPEGEQLFGRNFDYDETGTLVLYTEPDEGYASYGVVDLKFFGIGTEGGMDADSLFAKGIMLASPYICMDGINEAGVGVGILQLDTDEIHQDNGKNDLLIYAAIRGILDKCASVDEAVAFLESYDIQTALGCSYHLFITDKTGKSVVAEWTDSKMYIVEDKCCTNDVLSNNEFYDPEWECWRYSTMKEKLTEVKGILSMEDAMQLTSDISWGDEERGTEWSCVYNLDEFSFDICLDREYEKVYTFTAEDF